MGHDNSPTQETGATPRAHLHDAWRDPVAAIGTGFVGNPLDRCSERRDDMAFVAGLRRDPRARVLLFAGDVPLVLCPDVADAGSADAASAAAIVAHTDTPENPPDAVKLESSIGVSLNAILASGVDTVALPYALHETLTRMLAGAGFASDAKDHANADEESVLLGIDADGAPWFAQRADRAPDAVNAAFSEIRLTWAAAEGASAASIPSATARVSGTVRLRAEGLRVLASQGRIASAELAMLAQAKAVLDWHVRHRFCARCGTASRVAAAGWRRECPACAAVHFPRVDPVVIMIVIDIDGPNGPRCLLGRQPQFAPGMYSALAGFLEPGEAIEDAVRREVLEEAGIQTGAVRYLASQPWPFPGSLMIGCAALATSTALQVDKNELEDARWFDRGEVLQMLQRTHPQQLTTPQPIAIASTLIRAFAEGLLD